MKITQDEEAAIRLLRLCASPDKSLPISRIQYETDASGNHYMTMYRSLAERGLVRIEQGRVCLQ